MNPMDRASERLNRAQEHVDALRVEIEKFLATDPYHVEREDDPQFGRQFFRVEISAEPPIRISLIAADCVNSLRSILDNLVWGLSELNARRNPNPAQPFDERVPAFPICDSVSDWQSQKWHVRHLPTKARDFVKSMQPYHALTMGYALDENRLWLLHKLWNHDKHRTLSMLAFTVNNVTWRKRTFDAATNFVVPRVYHGGAIVGVVIPHVPHAEMDVEADFTFDVAFGPESVDGRPVLITLNELHNLIGTQILPRFRRWFSELR